MVDTQAEVMRSPQFGLNSTVLFITDPKSDLREFEVALRGKYEKDGEVIDLGDPLCNKEGIRYILGLTQSFANRVTILSNYDEDLLRNLVLDLCDTLNKDLMLNSKRYEIHDKTGKSKIKVIVRIYALSAIRRALNQGERKFLTKTTQEIHTTGEQTIKGDKRFLGLGKG